ncbi:hypothetical protein D3C71_1409700 [compost metagenome]
MRATSLRRTAAPLAWVRSKMPANSSAVFMRVCAVMVALSCWLAVDGSPPSCPAETCAFCAWMAFFTSSGVRLKLLSLLGSSQMRMAYCEPNSMVSPTPSTRLMGSCTLAAT